MTIAGFLLLGFLSTPADATTPHRENALFQSLIEGGATIGGQHVKFDPPRLRDDQSADAQRDALRTIAGSDRGVAEFLRDSVSAPFVLKVRDEKTNGKDLIRRADLWFAVRADLDAIDPEKAVRKASEAKPIEAGNMRFQTRLLDPAPKSSQSTSAREWRVHSTARLLDRIHVEATDRGMASRTAGSWAVASVTDAKYDDDSKFPNRWWAIARQGASEKAEKPRPFAGGASSVTISRLGGHPGVLVVEAHFAFSEPRAWFDGAPILRSKISLIAQDQIRRLRRELVETRDRTAREGRER